MTLIQFLDEMTGIILALTPLLASVAGVIAAYAAFKARNQSRLNTVKIDGVHKLVNSEMEAFKETILREARTAIRNALLECAANERNRNIADLVIPPKIVGL